MTLGVILGGEDYSVPGLWLALDVAASLSCANAGLPMQSRFQINIYCTSACLRVSSSVAQLNLLELDIKSIW